MASGCSSERVITGPGRCSVLAQRLAKVIFMLDQTGGPAFECEATFLLASGEPGNHLVEQSAKRLGRGGRPVSCR